MTKPSLDMNELAVVHSAVISVQDKLQGQRNMVGTAIASTLIASLMASLALRMREDGRDADTVNRAVQNLAQEVCDTAVLCANHMLILEANERTTGAPKS
jgi:hypothetical protein